MSFAFIDANGVVIIVAAVCLGLQQLYSMHIQAAERKAKAELDAEKEKAKIKRDQEIADKFEAAAALATAAKNAAEKTAEKVDVVVAKVDTAVVKVDKVAKTIDGQRTALVQEVAGLKDHVVDLLIAREVLAARTIDAGTTLPPPGERAPNGSAPGVEPSIQSTQGLPVVTAPAVVIAPGQQPPHTETLVPDPRPLLPHIPTPEKRRDP